MTTHFINSQNSVQGNESVLKEMVIDNNTFNDQEPFTKEDSQFIHHLLDALDPIDKTIILKQITILDTDLFDYTNYLFTFEIIGPILTRDQNISEYSSIIHKFMYRYNDYTENAGSYQIVRIQGTNIFQAFYQIG